MQNQHVSMSGQKSQIYIYSITKPYSAELGMVISEEVTGLI